MQPFLDVGSPPATKTAPEARTATACATSLAPALAESFGYIACTSSSCELNGTGETISSGAFGLDVDLSQPNTYTAFWGDSTGVHRFASPLIL